MKNIRLKFLLFMYEISQKNYRRFFKRHKRQWEFTEEQLLYFQADSLGRKLGEFYKKHGIRMIPQMENHDVYHLITGCGMKMQDEIAMQYLLFGNGKRSAYLLGVLFLGTVVFPEDLLVYVKAYQKGKKMKTFHHLNFEELLVTNFQTLKDLIIRNSSPAKI